MPVPQVTQLSPEVLEPVPEQELVAEPASMTAEHEQEPTAPPSFAIEETAPGFVPPEVSDDAQARSDYNAVARLVDSRVKRQTHLAVFALLAAAGLAVVLVSGLE